jgi:hypothetical protein
MGLDPNQRRRRKQLLLFGLVGAGLVALGVCLWLFFAPWGTGEVRPSPDGRWVAMAVNVERRTLFRGKVHYLKLTVEDKESGRLVWEVVSEHEPGADVPDYSHPGIKFVVWSADAAMVTFPIGGGKTLTVPVK